MNTTKGLALEYRPVEIRHESANAELEVHEPAADIMRIFGVVRRQYPLAIAGAVLALLLAIGFLAMVQPSYRSSIRILLDQDRSKLLTEISGEIAPSSTDEYIATQLAVVGSDIIARRVVHELSLTYDPDEGRLRMEQGGLAEKGALPQAGAISAEDLVTLQIDPAVVNTVRNSVSVYQVEKSFVLEIAATDPDPDLAQQIAKAYGVAYLTDQLSARFEATRNAGSWLEGRIDTLRDQSLEASVAVEKFRKVNNLVSTDGRLVSDQQLSNLNTNLAAARTGVTRAAARVVVLEDAVNRADVETILSAAASAPDIPESAPIRSLRNDYIEASTRARDVVARWGTDNDQSRALAAEVSRLSTLVIDEAKRILNGYRNDFDVAKSEADSIAASVQSATDQSQADNTLQVELRGLEQRATSYNALYQDYLARYQEAVQQQTLSLTTGRLISQPELPTAPIFPNKKIILALSLLLGVGAGSAIGVARELMDRTFRSQADVEAAGVDFLGYVRSSKTRAGTSRAGLGSGPDTSPVSDINRFDDAVTAVRVALDIRCRGRGKSVGFISLQPCSSRSMLALAYARREARNGQRVLLIDGDAEVGHLTTMLAPKGAPSFFDVLSGTVTLDEAIIRLEDDVLFLPMKADGLSGAIHQAAVEKLEAWRSSLDVIVMDLPPAGPISEARALASGFDAFVCTVKWGRTPISLLPKLVRSSVVFGSKLAGVVIADVAKGKLRLYDPGTARDQRTRTKAA